MVTQGNPKETLPYKNWVRRVNSVRDEKFTTAVAEHYVQCSEMLISGVEKLTRSSLKEFLNRALFAYKNGRFASSFLLGIVLL